MLDQDTFNDYSVGLVNIIDNVQITLIEKISRQLGKGKKLADDDWKLLQLQSVKNLEASMSKTVASTVPSQTAQIAEITDKAVNEGLGDTDEQLSGTKDVQSPVDFKAENSKLIENLAESLTEDVKGANFTMVKSGTDDFVRMVNEALATKNFGAITRDEAVQQVLSKWSQKGIPALVDRAGRRWQPDVYVNMVVRTNSMNIAKGTQRRRAIDYGQDLILTSQHADQSPEHAPYANKVFSLSGNDPKYPPFSQAQAAGFMNRPNCRHSYTFYVPGLTTKRKDLPKRQTDESYKLSQQQRKIENKIRKYKREATALESAGLDASTARANVRKAQAEMRQFIDSSGRTRRRKREQI